MGMLYPGEHSFAVNVYFDLLGYHGFDFLKRFDTALRCRRFVREQTGCYPPLTRQRRPAHAHDLCFASHYCVL